MLRKIKSLISILAVILTIPTFSYAAGNVDTVTSATQPATGTSTQTNTEISFFSADRPYTLEEMLKYAILDEYAAQALYNDTVTLYAAQEPFQRLLQDEEALINLLTQLLKDNSGALPDLTVIFEKPKEVSLRAACLAGIKAEQISIDMYKAFLAKDNLPEGVADVFQLLLDSSIGHLDALKTLADGEGWAQPTQYNGSHDDRDDKDNEDKYEDQDEDDDD